jgi:hypothetical protein
MTYIRSTVRPVKKAFVIEKTDLKNFKVIMERCSLEIGGIFNLILMADWFRNEEMKKGLRDFIENNDPDLIVNISSIENEFFKQEYSRKVITSEKLRFVSTPLFAFDHSPVIERQKPGIIRFSDSTSPNWKQYIAINYGIANPETLNQELRRTIFNSNTLMPLNMGFASHLFLADVVEKFQSSLLKMTILESFSTEGGTSFNPGNLFENRQTVVLGLDDDIESQAYFWSIRATFPWDVIVWLSVSDLSDLCKEKPEFDGEDFEIIGSESLINEVKEKNLFQKANFINGWRFVWGGSRKAWESFSQTSLWRLPMGVPTRRHQQTESIGRPKTSPVRRAGFQ